jgi:S-adenosylmethionine-dependent methyltransferase
MKLITSDEYDAVVDEWKTWKSYPWGRLLYSISRYNIQRHLDDRPLRVLDVGGGNGFNAIHYAQLGHRVTLLDYSPVMLSEARLVAEKLGHTDKIAFCQADAGAIQEIFPDQQFNLIICHLMLEFVLNPRQVLKHI